MAYTLADFSALAETPLKKAVVDIFRKESMLLDNLSIETAGTLNIEFVRTKTLPDITSRNIGEAFIASKGTTEPLSEQVCLLGGYIDIAKELVQAKNQIVNQRALQTQMFVTSMAYKFNDMFINGIPTSAPKDMVGLWYRIVNDLPAAQNIDSASGSGLDISPDASTLSTQQAKLIDKLDALLHAVDGHKADMLIMNSTMYLRLLAALRAVGAFSESEDNFGRKVPVYGGAKIIDLGVKADQTTSIIGDVETLTGAALSGGSGTSIYAVRFGEPHVKAWQFAPIDVVDKGMLENHVSFRTVIDWGCGMYFYNPRSVARLYGLIAA